MSPPIKPEPPGAMTSAEALDWAAREDVGRVELIDADRRRVVHRERDGDQIATRLLSAQGALDPRPTGLPLDTEDFWRGVPEARDFSRRARRDTSERKDTPRYAHD